MSKDTFWFRHDYDAADDDKTMLLIEQLGLEGYGIYWILIEKLRGRKDYKMPFSVIPSLARRYMTTPEKMKTVITQYELFQFDDDGFFYSISLIERMNALEDLRIKRSVAGQLGNKKRWGDRQLEVFADESIANTSQCDSTAIAGYRDKNRIDENTEEYKEKEDNKLSSKKKRFDFLTALLCLGVEDTIARDWLAVRKTKKMTNTETAFVKLKNQIELSGRDANHCISIAVEHSWGGFKAEWLKNIDTTQYEQQKTSQNNGWQTI